MNQTTLNRAVARATGETVDRIDRMGFSIVVVPPVIVRPIGNFAIPRLSRQSTRHRTSTGVRPLAAS
jgi:hypothetical protein